MDKNYTWAALALAKHNNDPYYIIIVNYYKCKTRKDYFAHYIKYIMKNDLLSIIRTYMKLYKLKKKNLITKDDYFKLIEMIKFRAKGNLYDNIDPNNMKK